MRSVVFTIAIVAVITSWFALAPARVDRFQPEPAAPPTVERHPLLLAENMEPAPLDFLEEAFLEEMTTDGRVRYFPAPWPPKPVAESAAVETPAPVLPASVTLTPAPRVPVAAPAVPRRPAPALALPAASSGLSGPNLGMEDPLLGRFGRPAPRRTASSSATLHSTALGAWLGGFDAPGE